MQNCGGLFQQNTEPLTELIIHLSCTDEPSNKIRPMHGPFFNNLKIVSKASFKTVQ